MQSSMSIQNIPMDPRNPNFAFAPLKRRQPSFDPDLRSLFSEEEQTKKTFTGRMPRPPQMQYPSIDQMSQTPGGTEIGVVPVFNAPSFPFDQSNQANPEAYSTLSPPWSDLEFLDNISIPDQVDAITGEGLPDAMGGLDMGFGLGWDGNLSNLNWNGNESVDMFNGFFFGGSGPPGPDQFQQQQ
jgi:hypothetical protein